MKRGDEIELLIEGTALEGKSVARVDGLVVFVRGAAPGDRVVARVTAVRKTFAEAETARVVEPSSVRAVPRCRFFGTCGGCTWQHVEYAAQLEFKRRHVIDALERIGGFSGIGVNPTLGCANPYRYRNKMEFSFGDRWYDGAEWAGVQNRLPADAGERFALGLHLPGRFDKVLDIDECWLQPEISTQILNAVRTFAREQKLTVYSTATQTGYLRNLVLRTGRHTHDVMVNLVTFDNRPSVLEAFRERLLKEIPGITTIVNNITRRQSQVALGEEEVVWYGPGTITERIGKRVYRISANSFFQTNTEQAERLYDTAQRMAGLRPTDLVYDLYSGTGTIALHIADHVRSVVGIESVQSSVEDATKNATANGVGNCLFVLGDLKESLTRDTSWQSEYGHPDVIILDPPRAGVHQKVLQRIRRLAPRTVVYVSCNPATQARDLNILCAEGLYSIEEIRPVDMFPHTFHIECVAGLSLHESS